MTILEEPNVPSVGAMVTGGAKGIGFAISTELARRGYSVTITGRDEAALHRAARDISSNNQTALINSVPMDVTNSESVRRAFDIACQFAPLTTLVNNAGTIIRGRAEELGDNEWSQVIETNLSGIFRCARAAYPFLEKNRPSAILNITSIGSFVGIAERTAYTASKAGIEGLTRTLALEWAASCIRVNTLAPGWTHTDMVKAGIASGKLNEQALIARIPLGRLARPEEIADAAAYLVSPQASYITGQTLIVDGGITINGNS